jgi:hypothetical protein
VTTTYTVVIAPTADPPGEIGGSGTYSSPRACVGEFNTSGSTTASTIDAVFSGLDCISAESSGFRQPFSGRIQVSK